MPKLTRRGRRFGLIAGRSRGQIVEPDVVAENREPLLFGRFASPAVLPSSVKHAMLPKSVR